MLARYTLAVNRRYKCDGEQEADFISCVTFGKSAEFAQKYLRKGIRIPTGEKAEVELRLFTLTGDFFPKIVVRKDIGKRWYDDNGILNINVIDFLLDKELI